MTDTERRAEKRARAILRLAHLDPDIATAYHERAAAALARLAGSALSVERLASALVLCEQAPGVSTEREATEWLADFALVTGASSAPLPRAPLCRGCVHYERRNIGGPQNYGTCALKMRPASAASCACTEFVTGAKP